MNAIGMSRFWVLSIGYGEPIFPSPFSILNTPYQQTPDGDIAFLLALAASFLATLTLAFFFMYLRQEQRRRRTQLYAAEIHNTGNVRTPFDLRLEEPSKLLGFEIYHQNELLLEKQTLAPADPAPKSTPGEKPNVLGAARQVGGFGSSLVGMLPPALAKPVQGALQGLSKGVMAATRADSVVKSGQKLGKSAGKMMPAGDKNSPDTATKGVVAPSAEMKVVDRWYETPTIVPGDLLEVTIMVDWSNGVPSQRYPFRLLSQASQHPETPQLTTNGVVALPREPWWVQALPVLFGVSATVAAALFVLMIAVTITLVV
jgi:hypothetical protein